MCLHDQPPYQAPTLLCTALLTGACFECSSRKTAFLDALQYFAGPAVDVYPQFVFLFDQCLLANSSGQPYSTIDTLAHATDSILDIFRLTAPFCPPTCSRVVARTHNVIYSRCSVAHRLRQDRCGLSHFYLLVVRGRTNTAPFLLHPGGGYHGAMAFPSSSCGRFGTGTSAGSSSSSSARPVYSALTPPAPTSSPEALSSVPREGNTAVDLVGSSW